WSPTISLTTIFYPQKAFPCINSPLALCIKNAHAHGLPPAMMTTQLKKTQSLMVLA
ncbi:hypothetical protein HMPREF3192_00884, partial [Atopobium deltae]